MEDQQQQPNPTLGIINVDSITEGIQNLQMILEESRIRLQPYMKLLLEEDDDEDEDIHKQQHTTAEEEMYNDINTVQIFIECIDKSFSCVDMLLVRLADSGLIPNNITNNHQEEEDMNVYLLMATNIICKANEFICHHCLSILEGDSLEDDNLGPLDDNDNQHNSSSTNDIRIQPLMARMSELALRVCHIQSTLVPSSTEKSNKNSDEDEEDDDEAITAQTIIETYSQYQRRCLRSRSKPVISSIAELRSAASSQGCFVSDLIEAERRRQQLEEQVGGDNDDENDENDNEDSATRRQPHAEALTVVLGEASSLLQPLAAWRDALAPQTEQENDVCSTLQQLCQESIELLDNEAQSLASTVGSWFTSDQRGVATLDNNQNNSTTTSSKSDLLSIESSLEEMAFICQVISRYCLFSEQILDTQDKTNNKLQDLLTEQSLHYSTLETRLATLQFNQAISLASPQLIELGRPSLQVPSIVEDAHFVCVRAIERASGTRSERAVWTVGHWVCEIWGIDNQSSSGGMMGGGGDEKGIKGVYRALMEGIGCTSDENNNSNDENTTNGVDDITKPSKVENAFAAALMEDLDDGKEQANGGSNSNPASTTNSAPSSGSLFFGRGGPKQSLQSRIDAEFCALNGISAAETACSALSGLFADLVEEKLQEESTTDESSAKMLTFARDELASHARLYKKLLQQRVRTVVADLCGGDDIFDCDGQLCLQNLRLFVEKEVYNLDGSAFRSLESEDRLETEIIKPIRQSQIYDEIGKDKCETSVVLQIAETMSWKSAEIILQVLLQGKTTFNEWGALLLSKQVRMLQNVYCGLVLQTSSSSSSSSTATILTQFERVNQAVSILQLEKPSDWLAFSYKVGESNETNLTREEIEKIMSMRSDFSEEAIARVCVQIGGATTDS